MSKKGENIYKRKDNRWEGRYKKGRKIDGKIKYGYIYGKTYKEVKEQLIQEKFNHQSFIEVNGDYASNYKTYCTHWLSNRKIILKESTYATYVYKLNKYVFPILGDTPLNQLTTEIVQSFIQKLIAHSLKAQTIHVVYQIMKKSLNDAYREGLIKKSLFLNILLPSKEKSKVRSISRVQEQTIESQTKKMSAVKALPVLLALRSGLRIGEISALKWEDIDFKKKTIQISNTCQRILLHGNKKKSEVIIASAKTTNSNRIIPIGANLYKWLKKGFKKATGPYVCSQTNFPIEPRLITYHFHKILKKCGLKNIHFHQLRHTFATRCIESQGNITAISAILGHASTKMTLDTYTDADIFSLEETIIKKENRMQKIYG